VSDHADYEKGKPVYFESEWKALVAERDEARAERDHWSQEALADRTRTAEARIVVLTEALTEIADGTILSTRFREIARAALDTKENA